MTIDPVAIVRGILTAIAALLTSLGVAFAAGTPDAPNDKTVSISQMTSTAQTAQLCLPTSLQPKPTSSTTATPDTRQVTEGSNPKPETVIPTCPTGTPSGSQTPQPTATTPTTSSPTAAPTANPTPTPAATPSPQPAPAPTAAPVPAANPPAQDPDFLRRKANCEKAIADKTAKAWHDEFHAKTNRTGWCEGTSTPNPGAPAPATPAPQGEPAPPEPAATTAPPTGGLPPVDEKRIATLMRDKYLEVAKDYCSFKISHETEGGTFSNPSYINHKFPDACTTGKTWEDSKAANDVRGLADQLDVLGLENLAHTWRVEVKTAAWQTYSNLNGCLNPWPGACSGNRHPVFRMNDAYGTPGADGINSEYWGDISGAPGATSENVLEKRFLLFADVFGPIVNAQAIPGQPEPTIGQYVVAKGGHSALNCAQNGRKIIPTEDCG